MSFYIAERNKETGKFELWMDEGEPHEISSESEAIDSYTRVMQLQGQPHPATSRMHAGIIHEKEVK